MVETEEEAKSGIFIITIILNIFIIIIALYLAFLFIQSKTFHTYPCYNMIIFSIILLLDCIIRLINTRNLNSIFQYIQAFFLSFFDKLILATLTMHALIFYLGTVHTQTYYKNEKKIFILSFVMSGTISVLLTVVYLIFGKGTHPPTNRYYHYVNYSDIKYILDLVFDSVYLAPNLYCTFILFLFTCKKRREAQKGLIEDLNYSHTFIRVILMLILNIATFLESYLIICDILQGQKTDVIYLLTCLIIDLYNSLNKTVFKETLKIFCSKTYEEKLEKVNSFKLLGNIDKIEADKDEDEDIIKQRTDSF